MMPLSLLNSSFRKSERLERRIIRSHRKESGSESLSLILATALVLIVVASIAVPLLPRAGAVTQSVDIKNFAFTPGSITIAPGDSVTWTNSDGTTHTVTGSGWASGNIANGATYTHQFNTTGDFDYKCSIHQSMTGIVHVGSGTTPPSKPLLSGITLIAVIVVAIIVVVALVAVLMRRKPAKKA
jgi:plastocyanin